MDDAANRTESAATGPDLALIDAVKAGDLDQARQLLAGGARVDARDTDDWGALDWAAGRGDIAAIQLLLQHGADPLATGEEQRRPYHIALAASHVSATKLLAGAEDRVDPELAAQRYWRPYCRAYLGSELTRYPGWPADAAMADGAATADADAGPDDDAGEEPVVFLHDDFTVTRSMWRGEDVVFDAVTDEWRRFCTEELGFAVPHDLDLVPAKSPSAEAPG